jgi:hypothetical protein
VNGLPTKILLATDGSKTQHSRRWLGISERSTATT